MFKNRGYRPLGRERGTKKPKKPIQFGKMLPLLLPAIAGGNRYGTHYPILLYLGIQLPLSAIITGTTTHLLKEK